LKHWDILKKYFFYKEQKEVFNTEKAEEKQRKSREVK
jgi:hypothetical protein